jgi:UDP-N-acetylglucosamine:LPS N-acetylglucosamine transferase
MSDTPTAPGPRFAFAGGGTGGHIVPGLHLLADARSRGRAPTDLVWFTSGRAVEEPALAGLSELAPACERVVLPLEPAGGGAPGLARLARRALPATLRARRALRAHRSEVLLGLGGFTSLPAVLAARSLGLPCALLEVNAVAGKATRTLSRLVQRVYHAWPASLPASTRSRHVVLGPPLDPALVRGRGDAEERRAIARTAGLPGAGPLLLVLGGSQGAGSLNRFLTDHAPTLLESGAEVLHQCGPGRTAEAPAERAGLVVREYLADVPELLRAADVVLCRGGASTLAEVAAARVPAVVVPYPHHGDQHQERNARGLGAGVRIVPDDGLDVAFAQDLAQLLGPAGTEERARRSAELERAVPTDSAQRILDDLEALARRGA